MFYVTMEVSAVEEARCMLYCHDNHTVFVLYFALTLITVSAGEAWVTGALRGGTTVDHHPGTRPVSATRTVTDICTNEKKRE